MIIYNVTVLLSLLTRFVFTWIFLSKSIPDANSFFIGYSLVNQLAPFILFGTTWYSSTNLSIAIGKKSLFSIALYTKTLSISFLTSIIISIACYFIWTSSGSIQYLFISASFTQVAINIMFIVIRSSFRKRINLVLFFLILIELLFIFWMLSTSIRMSHFNLLLMSELIGIIGLTFLLFIYMSNDIIMQKVKGSFYVFHKVKYIHFLLFLKRSILSSSVNITNMLRDTVDIFLASFFNMNYAYTLTISNAVKTLPSLLGSSLIVFFGRDKKGWWIFIKQRYISVAILLSFLSILSTYVIINILSYYSTTEIDTLQVFIRSIAISLSGMASILGMSYIRQQGRGFNLISFIVLIIVPLACLLLFTLLQFENPEYLYLIVSIFHLYTVRKLCT